MIVLHGLNKNFKKNLNLLSYFKNLLVMEVFLLDNYRSRSWSRSRSRKRNFFSAPAPAPAKNYGSGRLRLRNTGEIPPKLKRVKEVKICNAHNER